MVWIFAYIVIAFPLGWLFFQQPEGHVHFDRLNILELWVWGMTWPIIILLMCWIVMVELLRDR